MANNNSGGNDIPIGEVIRLSRDWSATLLNDGSVLLHHLSHVCIGGSGELVDLLSSQEYFESARHHLQEMDTERVGVRTILLRRDGSVVTDPDAISPLGLLSGEAYEAIPATRESSVRYFSRKSNKGEW